MVRIALLALVVACGCSSDGGDDTSDGSAAPDLTRNGDTIAQQGDQASVKSDAQSTDSQTAQPGVPGAICTQQNKSCGAGLICAFLETWSAPKGTCLRVATGGCTAWNDPRCVVTGFNYGTMCGPYTWNNVTTHACFLLCKLNGQTYDCPPQHTCKSVKSYDLCLPL